MSLFNQNSNSLIYLMPIIAVLYLLPTIIAFLFNRKSKMKILAANIPAGISWVMWLAVLAWAFTGKEKVNNNT